MATVTKYPIDFEALTKGTIIGPVTLERLSGAARDSMRYNTYALNLGARIEKEMRERGEVVTVRRSGHDLIVCDDLDATETNWKRFRGRVSGIARDMFRMQGVERAALPSDAQEKHDRNLYIMGKSYDGLRTSRRLAIKELKLLPHERNVPKQIETKGE